MKLCTIISGRKLKKHHEKKLTVPNGVLKNTMKGVINMGSNFNDLWNNPDFITEDEKEKIEEYVQSLAEYNKAVEKIKEKN